MSEIGDEEPISEPAGMKERFDRLEEKIDAQGRAIAFLLAATTQQPAQISGLQELLDVLGRERPGAVLPAGALVRAS